MSFRLFDWISQAHRAQSHLLKSLTDQEGRLNLIQKESIREETLIQRSTAEMEAGHLTLTNQLVKGVITQQNAYAFSSFVRAGRSRYDRCSGSAIPFGIR